MIAIVLLLCSFTDVSLGLRVPQQSKRRALKVHAHWGQNQSKEASNFISELEGKSYENLAAGHEMVCENTAKDIAVNLPAYKDLLEKGTGKTIYMAGDSELQQIWFIVGCGAEKFGWSVERDVVYEYKNCKGEAFCKVPHVRGQRMHPNKGNTQGYLMTSVLKPPGAETDEKQWFTLHFYKYYNIDTVPCPIDTGMSTTFAALFDALDTDSVEHMFMNFGHYSLEDSEEEHFSETAQKLIRDTMKIANEKGVTLTYVSHPPSHFATDDGAYHGEESSHAKCTCDIKNMETQYIARHNTVVDNTIGQIGTEFDRDEASFGFIDYWHDLQSKCDAHRGLLGATGYDCLHYKLSPTTFNKAIEGMADRLAQN